MATTYKVVNGKLVLTTQSINPLASTATIQNLVKGKIVLTKPSVQPSSRGSGIVAPGYTVDSSGKIVPITIQTPQGGMNQWTPPTQNLTFPTSSNTNISTQSSEAWQNAITPPLTTGKSVLNQQQIEQNQRRNQLSNAGFNSSEIKYLTSPVGGKEVFYNGKIVPKSEQAKAFYENVHQESLATERRFGETIAATGIVGLGLLPAAVSAPPLAIAGGLVVAGSQGTRIGQFVGNPFTNEKPTSGTLTQQEASKQGFTQAQEAANKDLFSNIIYNFVPGGQLLSKDAFIGGATNYLIKEKGYTLSRASKEATALHEQYNVGGAIGEVGGMITLSGGTELFGRTFVKKALKDTVIKPGISFFSAESMSIAAKSGVAIGKAGAIEGLGFYELERQAKMQQFDPITATWYTVGGAVSAGIIGGALVAGSFTNPRTAKWAQRALYSIDPTEKPGDVTADVVSDILGKNFNPIVRVTTITPTIVPTTNSANILTTNNTKSNTLSFTNTSAKTNALVGTNTNIFTNANTNMNTNVNTNTNENTNIFDNTNANTNENTNTNTNANTNTNTNTNTNANTNTNTNTNTDTNTNTNTNTNTTTITGAPIIPLFGIGGGGGGGGGRGNRFGVRNKTKFKPLFFVSLKHSTKNKTQKIVFIKQNKKSFTQTKNRNFFNTGKPKNIAKNKNFLPRSLKTNNQKSQGFFNSLKSSSHTQNKNQRFFNTTKQTKKSSIPLYKPSLLANKTKAKHNPIVKQNHFFNLYHKARLI